MTGAVASERVTEAPKGTLRMDGNHSKRMSAFLHVIQQISTDSMRCTSRMMRIADWRQGLPEYMVREMTEPEIAKMLKGEEPGESE